MLNEKFPFVLFAVTFLAISLGASAYVSFPDSSLTKGLGVYSASATLLVPPTVTAVDPPLGPIAGGATVTVFGSGFSGATSVTFGGIPAASFSVLGSTAIRAITPSGSSGAVSVLVTTASGTSAPNSLYTYSPPLNGAYPVGSGGNFTTLTSAVTAYNLLGITGPVTFLLTDANYSTSETFPVTIKASVGANSTNTLTIKPNVGVAPTISGTANYPNSLVTLNGASYVTIDGSNNGGNSRDLTMTNYNPSTEGGRVIYLVTEANNNTIKNVVVRNSGWQC